MCPVLRFQAPSESFGIGLSVRAASLPRHLAAVSELKDFSEFHLNNHPWFTDTPMYCTRNSPRNAGVR